ncbi:MAG TPA: nickel pincer cofactor biosynthesis protein LarB [Candidatus Bathyarchaeia archaeon]|nr:nickel pincer cofactor biosynthesis protein LarB [Candidatus Bathyarchaeia archaeon]
MSLKKFEQSRKLFEKKDRLLAVVSLSRFAKLDIGREKRKGLPEVILAEGKLPGDVVRISQAMVRRTGRAIISRSDSLQVRALRSSINGGSKIEFFSRSRMIIVKSKNYRSRRSGGRVGILTAGTSDIPVAEEVEIIAREMGCETRSFFDVGVAGIHRLFQPVQDLLKWDCDVIVVVAGREGALPTVVAGIVDVPVIGVPTSKSYGFGEKGLAALSAMLQSCSLGMAVVNIDGGVGAGAIAALIANRVGSYRSWRELATR